MGRRHSGSRAASTGERRGAPAGPIRRPRQRGMSLVELVVAFTIMMLLTAMAVPLAR